MSSSSVIFLIEPFISPDLSKGKKKKRFRFLAVSTKRLRPPHYAKLFGSGAIAENSRILKKSKLHIIKRKSSDMKFLKS